MQFLPIKRILERYVHTNKASPWYKEQDNITLF